MAKVERLEKLLSALRGRAKQAVRDSNLSVVVGFSAAHAIRVHENMEPKTLGLGVPRPSGKGVYWGPSQYGPKYLEGPARELAPELGKMVRRALQRKATIRQALLVAGMRLLRESQKRVPVEYGALRASGFTKLEEL